MEHPAYYDNPPPPVLVLNDAEIRSTGRSELYSWKVFERSADSVAIE